MKEKYTSTAQRIIVFIILIVLLFAFSVYVLNISAEIKRQKIQKIQKIKAEMLELQKEVQEWRRRDKEAIILNNRIICMVKNFRGEDLEEWYKTKEKSVREIKRVYGGRIKLAAKKHGIDPKIITAIIAVESSGDYRAVSKSNAQGLMQLKLLTAKMMGIKDPFHPYENVWAGTRYFKQLKKRFGNFNTALAAYNLGPTKVAKLLQKNFNPSAYIYVQKVNLVLAKI